MGGSRRGRQELDRILARLPRQLKAECFRLLVRRRFGFELLRGRVRGLDGSRPLRRRFEVHMGIF